MFVGDGVKEMGDSQALTTLSFCFSFNLTHLHTPSRTTPLQIFVCMPAFYSFLFFATVIISLLQCSLLVWQVISFISSKRHFLYLFPWCLLWNGCPGAWLTMNRNTCISLAFSKCCLPNTILDCISFTPRRETEIFSFYQPRFGVPKQLFKIKFCHSGLIFQNSGTGRLSETTVWYPELCSMIGVDFSLS